MNSQSHSQRVQHFLLLSLVCLRDDDISIVQIRLNCRYMKPVLMQSKCNKILAKKQKSLSMPSRRCILICMNGKPKNIISSGFIMSYVCLPQFALLFETKEKKFTMFAISWYRHVSYWLLSSRIYKLHVCLQNYSLFAVILTLILHSFFLALSYYTT